MATTIPVVQYVFEVEYTQVNKSTGAQETGHCEWHGFEAAPAMREVQQKFPAVKVMSARPIARRVGGPSNPWELMGKSTSALDPQI